MSTTILDIENEKKYELGEHTTKVNYYYVISYTVYVTQNGEFFIEYRLFSSQKGDRHYLRKIKKEIAITILSRLRLTEEQEKRVEELIPYFERERLKIQLHDRLTDSEKLLTDEDVVQQIDKVQHFSYFGEHRRCGRVYPHPPHVLGTYQTIRYGSLPVFCSGVPGELLLKNGKKVHLLITQNCLEDCVGKYMFWEIFEE